MKKTKPKTMHLINPHDQKFLTSETGPKQATWCGERAFIDNTFTENGIDNVTCQTCLQKYRKAQSR